MRVLQTIATIDPATGGPARSVPNLAVALRRQGLDVSLWTPDAQDESWLGSLKQAGVEIHSGDLENLPDFDVIHDHGVWLLNNRRVARHAEFQRCPRIVSPRGMLEPWAIHHKKWKKKLAWWLYQKRDLHSAAALHATAESEGRQFRALGLRNPIVVAPNGVEVSDRTQQVNEPSRVRTALFLSRIHPKKGLPMLVDAWQRVRPEGWRMRVVGPDEGGHRKEVEKLASDAGLADAWTFEDALDGEDKWDCYRNAELFILPTYSENFGIVVAEALACGIPVITTTGTPWEGLPGHRCGWWVEPNAPALAVALESAVALGREELAAMGGRGAVWMNRDFTWEASASQLIKAYQTLFE